jgi:hypothetical protein
MSEESQAVKIPQHKDKLGHNIELQDFVAYPDDNQLQFGRVTKISNKKIRVVPLASNSIRARKGSLKYPFDLVRLDTKALTWYILKNGIS